MNSERAKEPFLHRPATIVSLIAGVIGIATGVAALLGLFSGADESTVASDSGTLSSPVQVGTDNAAKIDSCVKTHGLAQALEKEELSTDRVLIRQCAWPPPVGAAPDGYAQIALAIGQGPGKSQAEGMTESNLFNSECQNIELTYIFDNMGTFTAVRPFIVSKGEIRRVEDGSIWRPRSDAEAASYAPRRDQFIVMSNLRYNLGTARCL